MAGLKNVKYLDEIAEVSERLATMTAHVVEGGGVSLVLGGGSQFGDGFDFGICICD